MTCQSRTSAARISSSKAATCSEGASGSSAPVQTSTLAVTLPETAGVLVARTPWKLTTALRSAPSRASSSTTEPPKQKPMAPSRSLQLICKDKGSVIRSRGDASDGDDHGCEGDFGKEVCCAAERRGTRTDRKSTRLNSS